MVGRKIKFATKSPNRLRAVCTKRDDEVSPCRFKTNVRYGEKNVKGESRAVFRFHITKIKQHSCNFYRKVGTTLYVGHLLARALL